MIDVDPESDTFGKWLADFPLPPTLVSHHMYFNNDRTKIYITALGDAVLHVLDITRVPYRLKAVPAPECQISENMAFSADGTRFYVACLGSNNVLVGDAITDLPLTTIDLPEPHPHGIAVHDGIGRLLVSSSNSPDFSFIGDTITAIDLATMEPTGTYRVSNEPSPAKVGPAFILFLPGHEPPVAFVNNFAARSLWAAQWDPEKKHFAVQQIFEFGEAEHAFPIAMDFSAARDRMYLATSQPGSFHIFDTSGGVLQPVLIKTLTTAPGAHHFAITADERYAVVQNGLINFPGMNDGAITVIDLRAEEVAGQIDTLKDAGLTNNDIILLPPWNRPLGG
jgi:DNA-binding beta-propeller fold protein YncE